MKFYSATYKDVFEELNKAFSQDMVNIDNLKIIIITFFLYLIYTIRKVAGEQPLPVPAELAMKSGQLPLPLERTKKIVNICQWMIFFYIH